MRERTRRFISILLVIALLATSVLTISVSFLGKTEGSFNSGASSVKDNEGVIGDEDTSELEVDVSSQNN